MAKTGFTLTSPAVGPDQHIARAHTCDGTDTPPLFEWAQAPEGTRSFALIMDDPDAPKGTFTHWLLWDIPAVIDTGDPMSLRGVPGRNDFQSVGYRGPCPPPGHGAHRYYTRLFALDVDSLRLTRGSTRDDLERAMRGHVLDQAEVVGLYERT